MRAAIQAEAGILAEHLGPLESFDIQRLASSIIVWSILSNSFMASLNCC